MGHPVVGDLVYGTPRLSGNTRPYAADNELGIVTAVEDAERHMVLWLSGDLENPEDASTFRTLPNDMRERPCNRSDIARKMRTVQLPAAWSNDEPQALDAQAAAQRLDLQQLLKAQDAQAQAHAVRAPDCCRVG